MILKLLAVLSVLLGICYVYYPDGISIQFLKKLSTNPKSEKIFNKEELKIFDGVNSELLYLSILGKVYDVTAGSKHYGPGSNYNIFVGRDASKSFITGEFSEKSDDLDDVLELSNGDLIGIENWSQMYDKQYIYKGKLIGRFYDVYGAETEYQRKFKSKLLEGVKEKSAEETFKVKYPPCNAEWDANAGSRVWCTKKSGGIHRNWEGVPRLLYVPGSSQAQCVCINLHNDKVLEENRSNIKEYEGCDTQATSCQVKNSN